MGNNYSVLPDTGAANQITDIVTSEHLIKAIVSGDYRRVIALLREGLSPNSLSPRDGNSALYVAVQCCYGLIVRILLREGANVDGIDKNENGITPLMIAAHQGYIEIVKMLLQAGANVFARDREGNTLLDYLTRAEEIGIPSNPLFTIGERAEILELISKAMESYYNHFEVLVNVMSSFLEDEGRSEDKKRFLKIVREVRASGNITQGFADFLRLAAEMEDRFLINAVLQAVPTHNFQEEGDKYYIARVPAHQKIIARALTDAAVKGQTKVIEVLATLPGFFIEARDKKDRTALMCAAEEGHTETAGALLLLGANIEARGRFGARPIHYAAAGNGDLAMINMFINAGADVFATDDWHVRIPEQPQGGGIPNRARVRWKHSLVEYAIMGNNTQAMIILAETGIDITAKNEEGRSPLDFAVNMQVNMGERPGQWYGHCMEALMLLVELGADTESLPITLRSAYRDLIWYQQFVSERGNEILNLVLQPDVDNAAFAQRFHEILNDDNHDMLRFHKGHCFLGHDVAVALKLILPEDDQINKLITKRYKLDKGEGQKEVLRWEDLKEELIAKFEEKGNPNPELAAKIALAGFVSSPKKDIFLNMVALASQPEETQITFAAVGEAIYDLATSEIPGFTLEHSEAIFEVMTKRDRSPHLRSVLVSTPAPAPTSAIAETLRNPEEQSETGGGWGEAKGYSPTPREVRSRLSSSESAAL